MTANKFHYEYRLIEGLYCTEGELHTGYGITLHDKDDGGKELARYPDISISKHIITHLVKLCNNLELDPIHLADIAEDFSDGKADFQKSRDTTCPTVE